MRFPNRQRHGFNCQAAALRKWIVDPGDIRALSGEGSLIQVQCAGKCVTDWLESLLITLGLTYPLVAWQVLITCC